jgi:hypothetical protein
VNGRVDYLVLHQEFKPLSLEAGDTNRVGRNQEILAEPPKLADAGGVRIERR